jgi:hypothetical protein
LPKKKKKKTMKKTLRGKPLCNNDMKFIREKVHKRWKEKKFYVCGHHPSSLHYFGNYSAMLFWFRVLGGGSVSKKIKFEKLDIIMSWIPKLRSVLGPVSRSVLESMHKIWLYISMFVLETRVIMWQRRFGVQGFAPETKFPR